MIQVPKEIKLIIKELEKADFKSYIVGGCIRDVLRNVEPNDWDIATDAKPSKTRKIFPNSFYENKFLTVTIQTDSKNPKLKEVEITTYRKEAKYTDKRHPDEIKFAKTIEEDLSRRDFTVNAMAGLIEKPGLRRRREKLKIIDPFKGQQDLKNKIIRTVGKPQERFSEDALRLLRAVRFATTLGKDWKIDPETLKVIKENSAWLRIISKERTRDELIKIIMSPLAYEGFLLLHNTNLLQYIIPELEKGVGITQNKHHIYTIFQHSLLSLKYATKYNYNLAVRLAALFHDIAKPQTKKGKGQDATFYNHDVVGAEVAIGTLLRLKFPNKIIEKVGNLIRYHMFYYDPEIVTESSVRRLLRKVGPENIKELIQLRIADRKGSGVPKARPYRLRHLEYIISKVSRHPISVEMLKIDGHDIMNILKIESGRRVGFVLNALLSEVLDDPKKNKGGYLQKRVKELRKLSDRELRQMEKRVEEKKTEVELGEKRKFHVQ